MRRWLKSLSQIRIDHLWAITVIMGIFMFLSTHPIRPHDFWWHMAIGRDIVTRGEIPLADEYSFTRLGVPYPSYYQFWLMEVILYLVYQAGGPVLIVLAQTAMVFPAYLLLLWVSQRQANHWRAAALGLLFAFALGFGNWNVRPQAISYLFGVLVLWCITEYRLTQRWKHLWVLPVVMALWVNCHGSFPIGLALVGIWLADEFWKILVLRIRMGLWQINKAVPAIAGMALAILGCLANPRGIGFVDYLSMMAENRIVQNFILEWMPPTFNSLEGSIFFAMFFSSIILLAVSPRRPSFYQILTFLVFGFLGQKYIRGIIWYGIAMAPIVAEHLAAVFNQLGIKPTSDNPPAMQRINRLFVGVLAFLALLSLPWFKPLLPLVEEKASVIASETPLQAVKILQEQDLSPNVFHDMAFGSYLMWAAQPEYKVFVDSRVELYPSQIWDDYFTISHAQCDWEDKLVGYGVNTLLLERENQALLIEAASASPNWKLVYQDQAAVVFSRQASSSP